MAMKAAPSAVMSRGRMPADWDASTISGTFRLRQTAAICSTGWMKPNTLDTWLQTTALVPGTTSLSKAAVTASDWNRGPAAVWTFAPRAFSGRVTALCS